MTKADVFTERVVGGVGAALRELPGPVLAHCASGMRSAVAWAAAAARVQPVDACSRRCEPPASTWTPSATSLEDQRDPARTIRRRCATRRSIAERCTEGDRLALTF